MTEEDLDPVMVDELAKAIRDCCDDPDCWYDSTEMSKEFYRRYARRALLFIAHLPLPQIIASTVDEPA